MELWRYYDITHRDHTIMNPTSDEKLDEMIAMLRLPPGARVLDIGCGKGEPLIRIAERYAVNGIGVDPSPGVIAQAKAWAAQRVQPPASLDFLLMAGKDYSDEPASFDLAMCLGASFAYGGYQNTLQALINFTRPGGLVLVGEPYWLQEPHPEYLQQADIQQDDFATYAGNVAIGLDLGLTPLYAICSTYDDFDHYEWMQVQAAERFAAENSHDPDIPELLRRMRAQRDSYLRYGRDTLGWALYLFKRPERFSAASFAHGPEQSSVLLANGPKRCN